MERNESKRLSVRWTHRIARGESAVMATLDRILADAKAQPERYLIGPSGRMYEIKDRPDPRRTRIIG